MPQIFSFRHKRFHFLVCISLLAFCSSLSAQKGLWKSTITSKEDLQHTLKRSIENVRTYTLNETLLENLLKPTLANRNGLKDSKVIIDFPNAEGNFTSYKVIEISTLSPRLAKKYSKLKSYIGQAVDSPSKTVRFSISPYTGLYVLLQNTTGENSYILRGKSKKNYSVYSNKYIQRKTEKFHCGFEEDHLFKKKIFNKEKSNEHKPISTQYLTTFKLALATTGEMSNHILEGLGIPSSASDEEKKGAILAWLSQTVLLKLNPIYERDIGIQFQLIDENEKLIFLNPNTDQLSGLAKNWVLKAAQGVFNEQIDINSYDVGHVLKRRLDGGMASMFSVCRGDKANGVTSFSYSTDPYIITLAHELGHQFGAEHTYNNCNGKPDYPFTRNPPYVETGSGNTIMSYWGSCGSTNVGDKEYPFFHTASIDQIRNMLLRDCDGNYNISVPIVSSHVQNITVPKQTPFKLEGNTIDESNDALTFTWSQMDTDFAPAPPIPTTPTGPIFRWLPPTTSPARYFPNMETIKSGKTSNKWEVLPEIGRTLNFAFTIRDNRLSTGAFGRQNLTVIVDGDSGPFKITSQNESNEVWHNETNQLIQWDVEGTNSGRIQAENVDIYLSTNGGASFDLELAKAVPNDGAHEIVVPYGLTTTEARIMVMGSESIFFDLNDCNIEIRESDFILNATTEERFKEECLDDNTKVSFELEYQTFNNFNSPVRIVASSLAGATLTVSPTQIRSNTASVTLTIENLSIQNRGENSITLTAKANGTNLESSINLTLNVSHQRADAPNLKAPKNNQANTLIPTHFQWDKNDTALNYTLQIATDPDFTSIIFEKTTNETSLTTRALNYETEYYWRMQSNNNCGAGDFSNTFAFTTKEDDRVYIPDDRFEQKLIQMGYDDILDNYALKGDVAEIKSLEVPRLGIKSFVGLEAFVGLERLIAHDNELNEIDVSNNLHLKELRVSDCGISKLDVSKNTKLEILRAFGNSISEIDITNNPELKVLSMYSNKVTKIDLSNNNKLEEIDFTSNSLSIIDVSNNPMLESLNVSNFTFATGIRGNNSIKQIDLSNNPNLIAFIANGSPIANLD